MVYAIHARPGCCCRRMVWTMRDYRCRDCDLARVHPPGVKLWCPHQNSFFESAVQPIRLSLVTGNRFGDSTLGSSQVPRDILMCILETCMRRRLGW